jgi:hypothetical protein
MEKKSILWKNDIENNKEYADSNTAEKDVHAIRIKNIDLIISLLPLIYF